MNRVYAKEKLIVDQEAKFKQDIKVLGTARINTDLRVDNEMRVDGTARFNGNVKFNNIELTSLSDTSTKVLIVTANGSVKKVELKSLGMVPDNLPIYCPPGDVLNPWWQSGLNKIFSPCPPVNVGIGTTTPNHKLHVIGRIYSNTGVLLGSAGGTTDALINGFAINNTQDLMQLGVKVGALTQTVKFRIQNKGSIQTSNSGSAPSLMMNNGTGHAAVIYANNGIKILQLEDNGMLRAREIKVDQNTWADYVFDKNYKLSSLKSVAKYINKNHHLPGVPTAKEIEADGLNLGDMQKIQMEKIEELYLHLIEMDEKMSVMETRMNELERENSELKKLSK